tara:strand:+ start:532 stop:729 length:198 start_codon:yes stop_codon:yes gene_type:complete
MIEFIIFLLGFALGYFLCQRKWLKSIDYNLSTPYDYLRIKGKLFKVITDQQYDKVYDELIHTWDD